MVADNIVQYWWWQWWRWWQWQRRGWWRWWRWWWWEKPRRQLAHLSLCGAERSTSLSPSSLSPSLSSSLSSTSSSSFLIKIHYSQLSTLKTLIRWFLTWVIISTPPDHIWPFWLRHAQFGYRALLTVMICQLPRNVPSPLISVNTVLFCRYVTFGFIATGHHAQM